MLINIEINIESFLEKFKNLAPVIVEPERLAPGNRANDCQTPNINASVFDISETDFFCLDLSAIYNKTENAMLARAITNNCLVKSINKKASRNNAKTIIGIVEINKNIIKLEFLFL